MEGDIYMARGSLQDASSASWHRHSTSFDAFSRGSWEAEDDEEALKWAALEKLPTFDRLRKGILSASTGGLNEVDVYNLGIVERRSLLERLVKVAEEDNEKFLLKLRDRIQR